MSKSKSFRIALGAAVAILVAAATSHAFNNHENRLTFNRPVALPGIVLPAGSYSFDLLDDSSRLDVVVVRNIARTKTYYLGFTNTVSRPRAMAPNAAVAFGEAPADAPLPIAAWYPIGQTVGHQFLYR